MDEDEALDVATGGRCAGRAARHHVGIPWALARVAGWPLPTTWPHLERLPDVLRDGLSDGFWVKAIALVVWPCGPR